MKRSYGVRVVGVIVLLTFIAGFLLRGLRGFYEPLLTSKLLD